MKKIYSHITSLLVVFIIAIGLQAQNVLKIQTGTIFSSANGAVVTLNNMDLVNDGIFNQGAGQSIFVFNGTVNNTISGALSPLFDILQISKTGGAKLTLQQTLRIGSSIAFGGGNIDLNGQNILLSASASLVNESETSHITGPAGGFVQIVTPLSAPSGANPGNLGAIFTSTDDLGSVIIRRGHRFQMNAFGLGHTILRYYDIIPSNTTALNVKLRMHYLETELNSLNENGLTIWKSSDNLNWNNIGFVARNNMINYVEQSGVSSFSRFTLTEPTNPLPLKWGSFNTQCISGQTQISWKTLQEQNTTVFVVRRSINGSNWTNIGSLPAAGNSQHTLSYTFTDPQPTGGTSYYQVFEQDFDGHQTYSPVVISQCTQAESIKVYPMPVQNYCWVSIHSERRGSVSMNLYNSVGTLLNQKLFSIQSGNNVFEFSLQAYPKGIYSMVFTGNDGKVKVIRVEKI
jgi:hypothetical protein